MLTELGSFQRMYWPTAASVGSTQQPETERDAQSDVGGHAPYAISRMKLSCITIVIPALNEEASVKAVVTALRQQYPSIDVIVVDDASVDRTCDLARDAGAEVISHDRQRGYGAALRTGVLAATRDYVLFCDADGQHSAEDVGRLIEAHDGCDMVIGVRGETSHCAATRRPGKWILRRFANYLAGEQIPDVNSGLRMVRRETLLKYLHLMPNGFSFSTTSTLAFLKSRRTVKHVPITVHKRVGESTVRQWRDGPSTMMLILRLTVLFDPLRVFLTISSGLLLLGLTSLTLDLVTSRSLNVGDTTVMLFLAALLVFTSGLLCDQVSSLRREIHE